MEQQSAKSMGVEWEEPVKIPEGAEYLWNHYWNVKRTGPLTFREVESYMRLCSWPLSPWEVEAVMTMDRAVEAKVREEYHHG